MSGNHHILWSFTDSTKIGYVSWTSLSVYLPKTVHNVPYRLSLSVKSANAGTYLGVRKGAGIIRRF